MNHSPPRLAVLAGMLALAACSKNPAPTTVAAPPAPVTTSEVDAVQAALMQGDSKAAEQQLKLLLRREPMNPRLLVLHDSIGRDPQELLGPANYPYTVRAGETIEQLAERLLGNRLKAYQLARYNGLANAAALKPGDVLKIPGIAPRSKPVAPPAEERKPRSSVAAPAPRSRPSAPAAAAPAAPAARPAANPVAARRARAAGLAALNRGAVREAVGMLQRAQTLDPGNAVIARDLQRAQRIAATVRARQ